MSLKSYIKSGFKKLPYKARLKLLSLIRGSFSKEEKLALGENNTFLSLQRLSLLGFSPDYVIDAGAYRGDWTREAFTVFPKAKFIAIEPLPEKKPILEKRLQSIPVKIYNVLAGSEIKTHVPFYSMETGSSVFSELTSFSREKIFVDMTTLDEIARKENITSQTLLKLDVQGFELEVLKGASSLLNHIEVICMELSFLNYNEGAPLAHDVISKMSELDFYIFDITEFLRKKDFSLMQADFVFIKSNSILRQKINDLKTSFNMASYY